MACDMQHVSCQSKFLPIAYLVHCFYPPNSKPYNGRDKTASKALHKKAKIIQLSNDKYSNETTECIYMYLYWLNMNSCADE